MNERIRKLAEQADAYAWQQIDEGADYDTQPQFFAERFAELIIEECRNVVTDLYRKTPLELCGPLITADQEIAKHFFGVEE